MNSHKAAPDRWDVICIGAGIVGLATARELQTRFQCRVLVLEAEPRPAQHQTGHNSGVIHSGLYYKPGSFKARNCVEGRRLLLEYCDRNDLPYELCGKLVIATDRAELPRLDELEKRARANGLEGFQRIGPDRITEFEPHATGVDALWIPQTGIVDYAEVCQSYARDLEQAGGELRLSTRVMSIRNYERETVVETDQGSFAGRALVNCAGLQCDRIARMAGVRPGLRIVPFRGDYCDLAEGSRHLLRGLIYPVPDPRFPFLGVHLTKRLNGSVEAGPNAVLALHREGYTHEGRAAFSLRDTSSALLWPGTWLLGLKYWRIGASEFLRAGSPARFARALARFVPEITAEDLVDGGCGIRAQALDRRGVLLDDFAIEKAPRQVHVLNAPSPAATASLSIARHLADLAAADFDLDERH